MKKILFPKLAWFLLLLLLLALCIYQKQKGNSIKPAAIAWVIYAVVILVILFLPDSVVWQSFVKLIM